jgi:hypothetical protein
MTATPETDIPDLKMTCGTTDCPNDKHKFNDPHRDMPGTTRRPEFVRPAGLMSSTGRVFTAKIRKTWSIPSKRSDVSTSGLSSGSVL